MVLYHDPLGHLTSVNSHIDRILDIDVGARNLRHLGMRKLPWNNRGLVSKSQHPSQEADRIIQDLLTRLRAWNPHKVGLLRQPSALGRSRSACSRLLFVGMGLQHCSATTINKCQLMNLSVSTLTDQVGQFCWRSNQDRRQLKWKMWPQGNFFGVVFGPSDPGAGA
jgi:hypothetical protein